MNIPFPRAAIVLALSLTLGTAALAQSTTEWQPQQEAALVDHFGVRQLKSVTPGSKLAFQLNGPVGAHIALRIAGAAAEVPMTEVRPGVYSGDYTVRLRDRLSATSLVTAFVTQDGHTSRVAMDQSLVRGARSPAPASNARSNRVTATAPDRAWPADHHVARERCAECGVVESVSLAEVKSDQPNVLGTIAGGVLGGVLGHQVGGGSGKDLAMIVGAVGGAYAGNRVENNLRVTQVHRVLVRMDSGSTRSIDYAADPALKTGVAVRIDNGTLVRL